ncbi:MAG: transcription termination factor NusA [Clostridia bacterium]|nr:transcription termination factor NusA [Clostridia bacterium]MDY5264744.1 transcription termination factor NusA [Eubacteriales bacterium]MDY5439756.1 transcription termination factor NusA [Eubacteriales bacterium]
MISKEFFAALKELQETRHIDPEIFLDSLKAGIVSAYKKEYGEQRKVEVVVDQDKCAIKIFTTRTVVGEVEDYDSEISLEEAQEIKKSAKLGDEIKEEIDTKELSRIAAQTAKQVIIQRLNDAKRDIVFGEMSSKEGELLNAIVRRIEGNNVYVEISPSQMEGVLLPNDQIFNEKLRVNDNIKVYVKKVRAGSKGAQVTVSRSAAGFVKRMFELEVPEIRSGLVQIKAIAREAGYRTKIAVYSENQDIDAIGACIGQNGMRINTIISELNGEKIDVIPYSENPAEFIPKALAPAKVSMVNVNEEDKTARVIVPDDKLSLAIGKEGQNVRLAARLTGWKIDVKPLSKVMGDTDAIIED